jgi:hypothetical protein
LAQSCRDPRGGRGDDRAALALCASNCTNCGMAPMDHSAGWTPTASDEISEPAAAIPPPPLHRKILRKESESRFFSGRGLVDGFLFWAGQAPGVPIPLSVPPVNTASVVLCRVSRLSCRLKDSVRQVAQCSRMNSPASRRVGSPGWPGPGVQTLAKRGSRNPQPISRAYRTSGWPRSIISSNAGRNSPSVDRLVVATASPKADDSDTLSHKSRQTGISSQETGAALPLCCGIDYFTRRVLTGASPAPRFSRANSIELPAIGIATPLLALRGRAAGRASSNYGAPPRLVR